MRELDHEIDSLTLSSWWLERRLARESATRSAEVIAMDLGLEYVRTVTPVELNRMVLRAGQRLPLSREYKSFRDADLVIEATDGESAQYIAVEATYIGNSRDIGRAIRNAGFLTEFTGCPAHPAIASVRNDEEINWRIASGEVHWHEIPKKILEPE